MCCTWCTAAYAHKHMIHDPLIQWNQEEINTLVKKKKKTPLNSLLILNETIYRIEAVLALEEKSAALIYAPDLLCNPWGHYRAQGFSFPTASYWSN